jgi:AcrR family transcriptional regulator
MSRPATARGIPTPPPLVPASRRERKKRALRAKIYQAAVALFIDKGYEETTIDEIAEAADVGRATFFNHYPSKEAILHELGCEAVAYARRTFDREFRNKSRSAEQKIRASLQRFGRIVERNPKYYQSVFLDVMRSQVGFAGPDQGPAGSLIDVLEDHLRAEQRRGGIAGSLDAAQLAEMLTGIYMYTLLNGLRRGVSYSLVDRMAKATEIFLRGCRPPDHKSPLPRR